MHNAASEFDNVLRKSPFTSQGIHGIMRAIFLVSFSRKVPSCQRFPASPGSCKKRFLAREIFPTLSARSLLNRAKLVKHFSTQRLISFSTTINVPKSVEGTHWFRNAWTQT